MINHYLFKIGKIYEIEQQVYTELVFETYNSETDSLGNQFRIKKAKILVLEKIKRKKYGNEVLLKNLLDGKIVFFWYDVRSFKELNS